MTTATIQDWTRQDARRAWQVADRAERAALAKGDATMAHIHKRRKESATRRAEWAEWAEDPMALRTDAIAAAQLRHQARPAPVSHAGCRRAANELSGLFFVVGFLSAMAMVVFTQ
jgi:hypothetical protein